MLQLTGIVASTLAMSCSASRELPTTWVTEQGDTVPAVAEFKFKPFVRPEVHNPYRIEISVYDQEGQEVSVLDTDHKRIVQDAYQRITEGVPPRIHR